jgi:hypothetical protein
MRRFLTGLATLAAVTAGVTMMSARSDAAGLPGSRALSDAADAISLTEKTQVYFWNGRRYCFYPDGWQGPGWYWCGYAWRRGFGYGGAVGWRGWGRPGGIYGRPGGGWMGGGFMGGGPGGFMGGGPGGFMGGGPGGFMGGGPGGGPMGFGNPGGGGFMGGGPMGLSGGGPMGGGFMGGGPMGNPATLSDVRAKHDVVLLGQLDNGLDFYRFSYNGSDKAYVGVMAQDVVKVRPDAVTTGPGGYLRVYYDRLGLTMQSYEDWIAGGSKLPSVSASIRQ